MFHADGRTDGRTDGHGEASYRYRFAIVLREGLFQLCIVAQTRSSAKKKSNNVFYFKEQLTLNTSKRRIYLNPHFELLNINYKCSWPR